MLAGASSITRGIEKSPACIPDRQTLKREHWDFLQYMHGGKLVPYYTRTTAAIMRDRIPGDKVKKGEGHVSGFIIITAFP